MNPFRSTYSLLRSEQALLLSACFFMCVGFFSASAETINIHAGDVGRGGFGDVAANLIMAQQLSQSRPGAEIRMLVEPNTLSLLATLEPKLSGLKTSLKVDGITYHLIGSSKAPLADVGLVFAYENEYPELENSSKSILKFDEYGGADLDLSDSAGVGRGSAGLYVLEQSRPLPFDRSKTFSEMKVAVPGFKPPVNLDAVQLGFAYSNKPESTKIYLTSLAASASKKQNKDKKYVVFVQHDTGVSMPPNVDVVYAERIPFQLSESLIAHSNIPVLVTGDVSATLAIQHDKPFFYEALDWKVDFAMGLEKQLNASQSNLNGALVQDMVNSLRAPHGKKSLPPEEQERVAKRFEAAFDSPRDLEKISQALKKLRQSDSLPKRLNLFLDHLARLPEGSARYASRIFESTVKGEPYEKIKQEVEKLLAKRAAKIQAIAKTHDDVLKAMPGIIGTFNEKWLNMTVEDFVLKVLAMNPAERRQQLDFLTADLVGASNAFREKVVEVLALDPLIRSQLKAHTDCRKYLFHLSM